MPCANALVVVQDERGVADHAHARQQELELVHLVDGQGAIVANCDYDPFGRLIARSGASADASPFLFSTKYLDEKSGFYYFGCRYHDPCSLKWLCRDPLGETAGPNLTAFCRNDPVNGVDPLGLADRKWKYA